MTSALILPENGVEIISGTSKTLQVAVTDLDGNPVDITGSRIVLSVKLSSEDRNPLIQKTTDDPAQARLTKPQGGLAEIYFKPADTQNLDFRLDYLFDIWLITAAGDRFAIVPTNVFKVTDAVTRIPL